MLADVCLSLLLATTLAAVSNPPEPAAAPEDLHERGILLIASDDPAQPYVQEVYEGLRDALAAATPRTLLFREFFDVVRFGDRPAYAGEFRAWLRQKYRDRHLDALVATQQAALEVIAGGADTSWNQLPLVYGSLGALPADPSGSEPTASRVVMEDPFADLLRLITTVVPNTRAVAVIRGASVAERARDAQYLDVIERQGLMVQDLGGLPLDAILRQVATLRSDTVPILIGFQSDATGRVFQSGQAIKLIAPQSTRPIFSMGLPDIGNGAIGGVIPGARMLGGLLAAAVLARLAGEPPRTVTVPAARHASASFDARQLARWGIPEGRLPAGSTVLFREPSLWRNYRGTVLVTLAVGATQSLLIVAVLVQRRHRARAQTAVEESYTRLRDLTGRLINAQEDERARIARNLHDDVGQRVASLSIALSSARRLAGAGALSAELTSLEQSAMSLSGELRDLSHDLHPGILEHVGLLEALRSRCDELAHDAGVACRLEVSDDWRDVSDAIALCLYRVAQEALRNIARHAGARTVLVALEQRRGTVSMRVMDDGCGFAARERNPGLGLLSLNERVSLLGGDFTVESSQGVGTTLAVTLPTGISHAA
jgi:signal transduction histidine kinase